MLCQDRKNSPWKAHLADVDLNMFVCVRVREVCLQVQRLGPSGGRTTLINKAAPTGGHTWSVWYSEASDRLSEKLRKFSWYSEHTIS